MPHAPKSKEFPLILLKTIFSFMICDGKMSPDELKYLRTYASKDQMFKDIDVEQELDDMVDLVNLKGVDFLQDYFKKVNHINLTEDQEITMLDCAMEMIQSDNKIKQDEINFLRILRTELKTSDDKILEKFPDIALHFVQKDDLTAAYIKEIYDNYFHERELPQFDFMDVKDISDSFDFGKSK